MKYRKLRIAWSVVWGILCLLLVVLWVRSFDHQDVVLWNPTQNLYVAGGSFEGSALLRVEHRSLKPRPEFAGLQLISRAHDFVDIGNAWTVYTKNFPNAVVAFVVPHWFAILASASLATAPWLPWRFGLRTLLIAMTLVAVGLGSVVYGIRK
jgi:hypothetical protein